MHPTQALKIVTVVIVQKDKYIGQKGGDGGCGGRRGEGGQHTSNIQIKIFLLLHTVQHTTYDY